MKRLIIYTFLCCNSIVYAQNFDIKLKPALEELKDFIAIPNDALVPNDIVKI